MLDKIIDNTVEVVSIRIPYGSYYSDPWGASVWEYDGFEIFFYGLWASSRYRGFQDATIDQVRDVRTDGPLEVYLSNRTTIKMDTDESRIPQKLLEMLC